MLAAHALVDGRDSPALRELAGLPRRSDAAEVRELYFQALHELGMPLPDDDTGEDVEDTSPWSTGPLIGEVCGPLIYFPMRWSMAEEASAYAATLAHSMGLICFDLKRTGSGRETAGRASVSVSVNAGERP
ncbi:hypothetical protein ACIBBD_06675 [Streptomyces sp. NPDC051315]|uniref:hypothetical protein n=1 Tax=Streptomyces sp. NPDC051315 TaxID=3365650 RepID=UPI00379E693F